MTEKALTRNEVLKSESPSLSGTIAATLSDDTTDKFSEDDNQFLKFHGIYQQDDRDKRKTGKEYSVMVRTRQTGGIVPPDQYLVYDAIADKYANKTLRLTTRQTFQFHGVVKGGLRQLIHSINEALSTTIATCGDVNRNVTAPPAPDGTTAQTQLTEDAFIVTRALLPVATSYHQIWIDGEKLEQDIAELTKLAQSSGTNPYQAPQGEQAPDGTVTDPIYGKTYLPRKFKIGFAIPPQNDTDIFTNDLGFVAIVENGNVSGYNLLAGGGLGSTHGNTETFPRLASIIGYFPRERVVDIAKAVITTHRDFGDRTNRKHARLKYVLEERGEEWFRNEVENRAGFQLAPARATPFTTQGDSYGWHDQINGKKYLTLFVETGRIKDAPGHALKTALREVVAGFKPHLRLTPSQNIILGDISPDDVGHITTLFKKHGVGINENLSRTRGAGISCPALPTCGLALTEAERVFPQVIDRMEELFTEIGLGNEEISVRMTGCPNGCARPYMAEIGLIGRAPNKYNIMLGGNHTSTRLNQTYRENIKLEDFTTEIRPLLARFKNERLPGEHFGDFAHRVLLNN
jgi:sulfite reductase (NADPH) hemoprotein beta-component